MVYAGIIIWQVFTINKLDFIWKSLRIDYWIYKLLSMFKNMPVSEDMGCDDYSGILFGNQG